MKNSFVALLILLNLFLIVGAFKTTPVSPSEHSIEQQGLRNTFYEGHKYIYAPQADGKAYSIVHSGNCPCYDKRHREVIQEIKRLQRK